MLTAEDLFKLIFLSYWGLLLLVLPVVWLIVWKTVEHGKRLWVASLISLFIVISFVAPIYQSIQKDQQKLATKNEKYRAAKAVFDERCKTAGIKIYKTVEDVEGVTLLNVWHFEPRNEEQMWEYAGLSPSSGDNGYIHGFLYWRKWDDKINDFARHGNGFTLNAKYLDAQNKDPDGTQYLNSYLYVDVLQNAAYYRYQYKKLYDSRDVVVTTTNKPSRYTVEFDNPVIPTDRAIWLATTKATIKDSATGEVLGEAIWHSLHGGQGIKKYAATGIWDRAKTCPDIANSQDEPIQYFTLKVLKPKQISQEEAATSVLP